MGDVAAAVITSVVMGNVVALVDAVVAKFWCYLWTTAPLLAGFCGVGLGVFIVI